MLPEDARSTHPQFLASDSPIQEGLFAVYAFSLGEPQNEQLIFERHNQLQRLGGFITAERMCGKYPKPVPYPYKIRASAVNFVQSDFKDVLTKMIPPDSQILPGLAGHPEYTVDNDDFEVRVPESAYERQYIEGRGLFRKTPPVINPLEQEVGSFYHFGLYSRTELPVIQASTTDTVSPQDFQQEVMVAYAYLDKGISYPEGIGIRVVWKIFIN